MTPDAIIIGAGLAGLSCARELQRLGRKPLVLEASDRIGGRLRTDRHDGFLLDHGFQVLLTAYPECQEELDYDALRLGHFNPGAEIWTGSQRICIADPLRQPRLAFRTALSPIGGLLDKLRIGSLKTRLGRRSNTEIYESSDRQTIDHLKELGFSPYMIEGFLRPFFRGIFLENELSTTSRMFDFVFKMFGQGYAALPAEGMAAIPQQLVAALPAEAIKLDARVISANRNEVTLESGETIRAETILIATEMSEAAKLSAGTEDKGWQQTRCYYFAADNSVSTNAFILLNASGNGPITNIATPSAASPSYAPEGQNLFCVSIDSDTKIEERDLRAEFAPWFNAAPEDFRFLKSYHIPQSLPRQRPGDCPFEASIQATPEGLWICGDHRHSSSIQGAMRSGKLTARAVQG